MRTPDRNSLKFKGLAVSKTHKTRGFALIVTLTLMVLLLILAIGLLSLSSVALRGSSHGQAQAEARANANLAMMLALGELQTTLGDDRRITADSSILDGALEENVVGVWESWSPRLSEDLLAAAPDYESEKEQRFLKWLVSGSEADVENMDWVKSALAGDSVSLFHENIDGFSLNAPLLAVDGSRANGRYAWAVKQENTRAKINVAGPELADRIPNDDLQAQPRPNLGLGNIFQQPVSGWDERAGKVIDLTQAELDSGLGAPENVELGGADFTTSSYGLLTDVVSGGLKVDLSLGMEMSDSDYVEDNWDGLDNPFRGDDPDGVASTPSTYLGQKPFYQPLQDSGTYNYQRAFAGADVEFFFPTASVPTFDTLRSFYRIPKHLYLTSDGVTAFEREADHVAGARGSTSSGYSPAPRDTFQGTETQMGLRPVVDKLMFLVSLGVVPGDDPGTDLCNFVVTPIITLWNPYNTALEIEGAVAFPWLDIPFQRILTTYNSSGSRKARQTKYFSGMTTQTTTGRSSLPYFFAAITADGQPIGRGAPTPVRFEPGEVRVFAPSSPDLKVIPEAKGVSVRDRTVFMRPVDDISQLSTKGGLFIRRNSLPLATGEQAEILVRTVDWRGEDYPFSFALEDATRARGVAPAETEYGQVIADIISDGFAISGETENFSSARIDRSTLRLEPVPVGVLETYHRVALSGSDIQSADLVYTGNPRQAWMNPFVTKSSFKTGSQYQMRMRAVNSFSGVLQTDITGRRSFYGASDGALTGRTNLSFFEIPQAPLLSLAALQHADFSPSPFSPANQFGNSWASGYVPRDAVQDGASEVDHCYLTNEALWDRFFFSGAAPTLSYSTRTGGSNVWDSEIATEGKTLQSVVREFAEDPDENPLRNPRMRLYRGDGEFDVSEFVNDMIEPQGCLKIAGNLMVDGAFNVNSTSVEAWKAMLSGLRSAEFTLANGSAAGTPNVTPFPRFRDPVGEENDNWHGYRTLSDGEIEELATAIVNQVQQRGPFLSLAEFVNRRVSSDNLGLAGALQAALDATEINEDALQESMSTASYDGAEANNLNPADTGVGIPGYLTQADLLKPLAPLLTARSDTFTIRSYGESRNSAGDVLAKAYLEVTVQRTPEFTDTGDDPETAISDLSLENGFFGRKFRIVSFRYLNQNEVQL
ncbi:MAG: hypothetical protein NWT08_04435 [Akkermansiaceae bacterium]|nr:hypothetical protein [Akkermansiaceae bacterium]MDP4721775.1 hypothetical protein [Akkermansiaceae bacterium]MDP4780133.1 hypothetical protein [Akkermansiaceae bacterium]MDP4848366.1 hypothetical protein [Akkermansiaceae bacterium]MDP4898377.1 hypothetical protein [Akkermansiaceae bacterium]